MKLSHLKEALAGTHNRVETLEKALRCIALACVSCENEYQAEEAISIILEKCKENLPEGLDKQE